MNVVVASLNFANAPKNLHIAPQNVGVVAPSHWLTYLQLQTNTAFVCNCINTYKQLRPGSSVGIVTDYGLDGPGIESRWGRDFSHTSRPALEPTQPPVQWVLGLSRG
jgi:hypothetical protein